MNLYLRTGACDEIRLRPWISVAVWTAHFCVGPQSSSDHKFERQGSALDQLGRRSAQHAASLKLHLAKKEFKDAEPEPDADSGDDSPSGKLAC